MSRTKRAVDALAQKYGFGSGAAWHIMQVGSTAKSPTGEFTLADAAQALKEREANPVHPTQPKG